MFVKPFERDRFFRVENTTEVMESVSPNLSWKNGLEEGGFINYNSKIQVDDSNTIIEKGACSWVMMK